MIDEIEDDRALVRRPCWRCDGTGFCLVCGGGVVVVEQYRCRECDDGRCPACGGTGTFLARTEKE